MVATGEGRKKEGQENVRVQAGLDDVIAAKTRLSDVDGEAGQLVIGGYAIEQLAGYVSYEEAVHLLWKGTLPDAEQLAELRSDLAVRRDLSPNLLDVLRIAASEKMDPIDALRLGANLLKLHGERAFHRAGFQEDALTIAATFPTIIASYWRMLQGEKPVLPRADLNHAANYLYMLMGQEPNVERTQALETYLVTVIDHGLSASTFAARTITSTGSDLVSAVIGAIGALKGSLHGGAPGPVLEMLQDIGPPAQAAAYLRAKLERGERLMGFGHRDYKTRDPRAVVLEPAAKRLYQQEGLSGLYTLAKQVEREAVALLEQFKPGRKLHTNLELWVAVLLHGVGLPPALFTPTFAASRAAGWAAHCLEQQEVGRLVQPKSLYVGERNRRWVPLSERQASE